MLATFDAFQFADLIAPRALLVVVGRKAVTAGNSMRAFEKASEAKEAFWIDGATHQGLYDKPEYVNPAVAKLGDFYRASLKA